MRVHKSIVIVSRFRIQQQMHTTRIKYCLQVSVRASKLTTKV